MKVLIVNGGFRNKGAEAMLATLAACLRERFSGCALYHPCSNRSWENRFRTLGVTPITPRPQVSRSKRWLELAKGFVPLRLPKRGYLPGGIWQEIDAVLDIAGFKSGDKWGVDGANGRWWRCLQLQLLGVPFVYLPQAWGTFRDPRIWLLTRLMLRDADLVYARDERSYQCLQRLMVLPPSRLRLAADIALNFKGEPKEVGAGMLEGLGVSVGGAPIVGITPNMQVYGRVAGRGLRNKYVAILAAACRRLITESDVQVVVIPHSIRKGADDDDRYIGRLLTEAVGSGRLYAITRDYTAAELKSVIECLDYLVASRFHTIIAAFSLRIPVVALGWSHKYRELLRSTELEEYAVGIQELGASTVELVMESWRRRDELKEQLVRHVPALEKSSRLALQETLDLVDRRAGGSK